MMLDRCHSVPPGLWPDQDRRLWDRGLNRSALLDPDAVAAKWRPRTIETVAAAYGYGLHWLQSAGPLEDSCSPADRWTRMNITAYVGYLERRVSPATVFNRILNLERALAVMEPRSDRRLLRAVVNNLPNTPNHAEKRSRLQEPAALVDFGFRLMKKSMDQPAVSIRKNATLYRDGLQIALLASRPMRKKNLAGINIGQHLFKNGDNWCLAFDSTETKTHAPLEFDLPEAIVPALEYYLDTVRPLLAGQRYTGPALWASYRFTRQAAHSIQLTIVARTRAEFGSHVNPHLFRDCAATFIAVDDPENVRMAAAVLGHRSFATTQRHYNLAQTVDASRSHTNVIEQQRARFRKQRKRNLS